MVAGFPSVDFNEFHRNELPRRLDAGNAALAATEAARLRPLAIRLRESGDAYSYVPRGGEIAIVAGDEAAELVVEIDQEAFEGLVHDVETPPGLIYSGRIEKVRGEMMNFVLWEPSLRAMFHGRPIFDPDATPLLDRHGDPLDPTRSFEIGDDREDMADFLRVAGYLLVKQVFSPEEIATFREQAEILRERAVEGDRLSWWAKNGEGDSILCRVIHASVMPAFHGLPKEPRLNSLASLSDAKLTPQNPDDVNSVSVLWKNPGVTEGLSDLPWHRDCGMGGHATMCPTIVCSTFLEPNTPEAGALSFLPGSWNSSYGFFEATDARAPKGVTPPAEPGDVTLHYGDGMHVAPAPTSADGPFRVCVLTGFRMEGAHHHRGDRHYNDVLLGQKDGQVEHMKKVADRY